MGRVYLSELQTLGGGLHLCYGAYAPLRWPLWEGCLLDVVECIVHGPSAVRDVCRPWVEEPGSETLSVVSQTTLPRPGGRQLQAEDTDLGESPVNPPRATPHLLTDPPVGSRASLGTYSSHWRGRDG